MGIRDLLLRIYMYFFAISSSNLRLIPEIKDLEKLSQSLAMLDAILCPDKRLRYYFFHANWKEKVNLATMSNGFADDYVIVFNEVGALIKGFAHESPMTPYKHEPKKVWPGVLTNVPREFSSIFLDTEVSLEDTTFCIWRKYTDSAWQTGNINFPNIADPDGSQRLLFMLNCSPITYKVWADAYYEKDIPLSVVQHIFQHLPLNDEIISVLNNKICLNDLEKEILEIAYPS